MQTEIVSFYNRKCKCLTFRAKVPFRAKVGISKVIMEKIVEQKLTYCFG